MDKQERKAERVSLINNKTPRGQTIRQTGQTDIRQDIHHVLLPQCMLQSRRIVGVPLLQFQGLYNLYNLYNLDPHTHSHIRLNLRLHTKLRKEKYQALVD